MGTNDKLDAIFALCWAALLVSATAYLFLARKGHVHGVPSWFTLSTIVLVVLVVLLIPAILLDKGALFDIESYRIVGHLALAKQDVYGSPAAADRYPYLPLYLWISALAVFASMHAHVAFVIVAKMPDVLADVGIALCLPLGLIRRGIPYPTALAAGLLYAVNPVSVMVTAYHGQFDALPLLGCIGAWVLLAQADPPWETIAWAGLCLGGAILAKTWPLLILPAYALYIRTWRRRILLSATALFVPAVATTLYCLYAHASITAVVRRVFGYGGISGWWGSSLALLAVHKLWDPVQMVTDGQFQQWTRATEVLIALAALVYLRRGVPTIERGCSVLLLQGNCI